MSLPGWINLFDGSLHLTSSGKAGYRAIYFKDGLLYSIDDAGNITPISNDPASSLILFHVPTLPSVAPGEVVRMSAGTAIKAQADSLVNANFLGIVKNKPTPTTANVVIGGILSGVFTGLDETKEYFLSETVAGAITTTVPATGVIVRVGFPFDDTQFIVSKGDPIER